MKNLRYLLWSTALIGIVFVPAAVTAQDDDESSTYPKRSIRELATSSDLIIAGRIVRVMSVERENDLAEHSYNQEKRYEARLAWIEIDDVVLGNARKNQKVKLVYPASARVPGEPIYEEEQQGVWFLRKSTKRGEYLADHPRRYQPLNAMDRIRAIVSQIKTSDGTKNGKSKNKKKRKSKK